MVKFLMPKSREFKFLQIGCLLGLFLMGGSQVTAQTPPPGSEALQAQLAQTLPDLPIDGIYPTELDGFYYVELTNGQSLYGSKDGKYLFSGDLYRVDGGLTNLAEERRSERRSELMAAVPMDDMIVFSPASETKTHINVFTDVDCGYCRKLHLEMADMNALGIEVRYLAYPRQGMGTQTHAKIVSAWCADDKREAITALKTGRDIPSKVCQNPVQDQYELGQQVGVTGTPAIVTADGRLLPGYMPAAALAEAIGLDG